MVSSGNSVYSLMNGLLYKFDTANFLSSNMLNWVAVNYNPNSALPPSGLINYGMEITQSGKIVIFGGQVDTSNPVCSYRQRNLTTYSNLWLFDTKLSSGSASFVMLNWNSSVGGFSKIVHLFEETLLILNPGFSYQARVIDILSMTSYDLPISGIPAGLMRTAFGIVKSGVDNIWIYGGYDQIGRLATEIDSKNALYQISVVSNKVATGTISATTSLQLITTSSTPSTNLPTENPTIVATSVEPTSTHEILPSISSLNSAPIIALDSFILTVSGVLCLLLV
jgi:hypothetical protein